jgi:putative transposase
VKRILSSISGIAECVIEQVEVMPDHVHLMISIPPKYTISDTVKNLKGSSARLFLFKHPDLKMDKFWGGHLWSASYCIGSAGNMSKETVAIYNQNQYETFSAHLQSQSVK